MEGCYYRIVEVGSDDAYYDIKEDIIGRVVKDDGEGMFIVPDNWPEPFEKGDKKTVFFNVKLRLCFAA